MSAFGGAFLVLGLLALGYRGESSSPACGEHFTLCHPLAAEDLPAKKPSVALKKPRPRFTVSLETTVVTGPLDKDGYIDYVTALNQRLSQGATPANNANVLIWKALGPRPEGSAMPPEFFDWMGIEAPPERGNYYVDVYRYLRGFVADDVLIEQSDEAASRPWTSKEYPHFAGWLKANEKPLALVVAGTKRSHYFSPLVAGRTIEGPGPLIAALLPAVQRCRELAHTFCIRAMWHLGEGRHDAAWQDLLACHRLARHVGSGGTLIEGLVGIALDHIASAADLTFLAHAKRNARQLRDCLRDLQQLPPLLAMAERVGLTERFICLDMLTRTERSGLRSWEPLLEDAQAAAADPKVQAILATLHWDPSLRTLNRWLDRLVDAMHVKDRPSRQKQLAQIDQELRTLKAKLGDVTNLRKLLLDGKQSVAARNQLVGDALCVMLIPAVSRVQQASDRIEQVQRNLQLAFALAVYHREHGRYPEKLDALAPRYLAQVPQDLFSGRPLIYRPAAKGYLFYSVGVNGVDDQGRGYDDDPPGDDLSVRIPLPKPRE
jgi:hypothetical protein